MRYRIDIGGGIGPCRLGMSRSEVWSIDRSPILSYYPQSWSVSRSDEITLRGVTLSYDRDDRVNEMVIFTTIPHQHPITIELFGSSINGYNREEITLLLDTEDILWSDDGEIRADGIAFGCIETGVLDYIKVVPFSSI